MGILSGLFGKKQENDTAVSGGSNIPTTSSGVQLLDLNKGDILDLNKYSTSLTRVRAAAGWDVNQGAGSDFDLVDLNEIYKRLKSCLKKATEDSLLDTSNPEDEDINIQIDIVKYIFEVKKEEIDNQLKEKERADKRQEIMAIIAAKDAEEMQSKSKEELLAMLRDL